MEEAKSEKNDTQNQTCQKLVDQIETKMHKLIGIRTAETGVTEKRTLPFLNAVFFSC